MSLRVAQIFPVILGFLLGFKVFASEPSAVIQAPIQTIFPNAFGVALLRHYNEYTEGSSKLSMQARYYLGSTFFDSSLKSQVAFGVRKHTNTSKFEKRHVEWENFYTLFSNDYLTLTPWAQIGFREESTNAILAFAVDPKYVASTSYGALTLYGQLENGIFSNSKDDKAEVFVKKEDSLALTASEADSQKTEISAKTNRYYSFARAAISYEPNMMRGLKLAYRSEHTIIHKPIHRWNEDKKRVEVAKKGKFTEYKEDYLREHIFELKYEISKDVYARNEFILKPRYQDESQYKNIFGIVANVF